MEAAELFTHHAIVDLETTGLDPSQDEVIELGVLFIERGEPVRRLSRLFRSSRPLPLAIQRLTGIHEEDLEGRPRFGEFVPELKAALAGWTVVAHNAAFERSFLSGLLAELEAPVLDSCELLHYLYPELESHSLEALIRWAGVGDRATHRALADCEDTFAVVCRGLERCIVEGRTEDVSDLLSTLRPPQGSDDPGVVLLERLLDVCRTTRSPLTLSPATPFLPPPPGRGREVPRSDSLAEPPTLSELLGPGGALERSAPGFRSRPSQLHMAEEVEQALERGAPLAFEGATGTGKSLAYLAAAVRFASRRSMRVGIAPHTKALQDQLVDKDLPKLHRATGGAFSFAVLKGQQNYLCRRRALELTRVEPSMGHAERAPRAYLRAFLRRSPGGELDRLSFWFRERYPLLGPLSAAARSEAGTTLAERCPHYRRCFFHSAVSHARDAEVVVINQSLALGWPDRYPRLDRLIVDEAHELEDVATSVFASEISDALLEELAVRLGGRSFGPGTAGRAEPVTVAPLIAELEAAVGTLVEALGEGDERYRELAFTPAVRDHPAFARVTAALTRLADTLEPLGRNDGAPGQGAAPERELRELSALLRQLATGPREGFCEHARVEHRANGRRWTLTSEPIEVSALVQQALACGAVLTSATLSVSRERPWALDRLGMGGTADVRPRYFRAQSPFDLRAQGLVVLVTDAPDPQTPEFVDWAAARIIGLAQFMGGRVLGLFASSRRLQAIALRVSAALEPAGIEVLQQARGLGRALAARQERDVGSVLLGTKTFWQGIDIPGRGVGCVFIDKLPLEPHTRPLVAAREAHLGGATSGFLAYRLPRALLLLRQGVGRLIRSPQDRGVVILADPGSPAYRAEVLAALDDYRVVELPWAQARRHIRDELTAMGLAASAPTLTAAS